MGRQQLIEAVWGQDAPGYAVNLLQKHVSGLRRVLEPDRAPGHRHPVAGRPEHGRQHRPGRYYTPIAGRRW
jgi:hypothetical protein